MSAPRLSNTDWMKGLSLPPPPPPPPAPTEGIWAVPGRRAAQAGRALLRGGGQQLIYCAVSCFPSPIRWLGHFLGRTSWFEDGRWRERKKSVFFDDGYNTSSPVTIKYWFWCIFHDHKYVGCRGRDLKICPILLGPARDSSHFPWSGNKCSNQRAN